ncbi:hypothetical protein MnTg04_00630 [bacterium MnTg04]|nr:hypothetical protein MnTg04_00630 [bacterium MnTg04]
MSRRVRILLLQLFKLGQLFVDESVRFTDIITRVKPELIGVQAPDQKENYAQDQVHPKWRHVTRPPAGKIIAGQQPRAEQQGNQAAPQSRVQFEQVAYRLPQQFPQGDQADPGALSALPAVLTMQRRTAVGAIRRFGHRGFRLVCRLVPEDSPARTELITEFFHAERPHSRCVVFQIVG